MNYIDFFDRLKTEDSRIKYDIISEKRDFMDDNIPEFYKVLNPINVEFECDDGMVRLVPFEELMLISKVYQYVGGQIRPVFQ